MASRPCFDWFRQTMPFPTASHESFAPFFCLQSTTSQHLSAWQSRVPHQNVIIAKSALQDVAYGKEALLRPPPRKLLPPSRNFLSASSCLAPRRNLRMSLPSQRSVIWPLVPVVLDTFTPCAHQATLVMGITYGTPKHHVITIYTCIAYDSFE